MRRTHSQLFFLLLTGLLFAHTVLVKSFILPCQSSARAFVALKNANDNNQGVTPTQLKELRKEAAKRLACKSLVQVEYPDSEGVDGDFVARTCQLLEDNELVQVRGISLGNKRMIFQEAEALTYELNLEMGGNVEMVDLKGHAATFYSASPDKKKRKIILRTSYQEGAWEKRPKKPRDHRGQIIKD